MKLSLTLLVVIMVMSGVGYLYYKDTQSKLAILQENVTKLEIAIAANEETINNLQKDYAAAQAENQRINQAYADIRRQNNRLAEKIADIDLGLLAAEKPESMERAVNRGTINAGRCFELLSGSQLTEEEKNAKSGDEFNKECPWLWVDPVDSGVQPDQQNRAD